MVAKPSARRKFSSVWQEIDYLYERVAHWFCHARDRKRAAPFADRLAALLKQEAHAGPTPFTEGAWSLLHELDGDLAAAIVHRENEIRLLKRLFAVAIARSSFDLVLAYYDYQDLVDRLGMLAALYRKIRRPDDAIKTLDEAKRLARTHGLKFAGDDRVRTGKRQRSALRNGVRSRPRSQGARRRTPTST